MPESDHAIEHHLRLAANRAIDEALRGISIHGTFKNYHEAYAVILEEFDELWEEIKRKGHSNTRIGDEADQVVAMSLLLAAMAHKEAVKEHDKVRGL